MALDQLALNRWMRDDPDRERVVAVLRRAGLIINYIHTDRDDRTWGLIVGAPAEMRELFGIRRELLIWGAFYDVVDARSLASAREFLSKHELRVTQDVLVIVTTDPAGQGLLSEAVNHVHIALAVLTTQQLPFLEPYGVRRFIDVLRPQLYVRDLYDLRPPVTASADFFGRRGLLAEMRTEILAGKTHIGLFGLRKIGKTSFINRLQADVQNHTQVLAAHVDLQRTAAINPSAPYLLWHLGEALADGNRRVRDTAGLRLFGKFDTFTSIPDANAVYELFDHDVRRVIERVQLPVVLILDEIERIFPAGSAGQAHGDFVRFWQLLRGIDQEQPGRLRFVISGTNPECVESHSIGMTDNPIYSYFSITYIRPLSRGAAAELLTSYGKLMGLHWPPQVIDRAYADTGGHPALLRTYASMMHKKMSPRDRAANLSMDDTIDLAADFLTQQSPLLAQLLAILEDQYPDEFTILQSLALGRVYEFREMARAFPEDTAHLIGYGLCTQPDRTTQLSSRLLHNYLQLRDRVVRPLKNRDPENLLGEVVEDQFVIDALISSTHFSNVYRAHAADNDDTEDLVVKVMPEGRLSLLEREVEALQQYDHPNIVRLLGSGRLDDSRVYVAMELVTGQTLRHYCHAATRPPERQLMQWLWRLLDALVALHPREREIRHLRATLEDERDLEALLGARYGYIHRDIKPENIIINSRRGPVLIDFNIASKVSSPVVTITATPGYLPPSIAGGVWSPRVDLYQLGLTMLQAAAGDELTEINRADLFEIARSSLSAGTVDIIEKLCIADQSGFSTAFTARREVQRALDKLVG